MKRMLRTLKKLSKRFAGIVVPVAFSWFIAALTLLLARFGKPLQAA